MLHKAHTNYIQTVTDVIVYVDYSMQQCTKRKSAIWNAAMFSQHALILKSAVLCRKCESEGN